jgi:hypothetical protein
LHPYATNSEERTSVPFCLALVAIIFAWFIAGSLRDLHLPFWVEVPGTATLYALLLGLFRSYVWRGKLLHKTKIVRIPNIEGEYHGHVSSSFDSLADRHPVTLNIRQNWTHISICLSAEHSESRSLVASIYVNDEITLTYQYNNVPRPGARETMHAHDGTASLRLSNDGLTLVGEYYSGRDRTNQGTIRVAKRAHRR